MANNALIGSDYFLSGSLNPAWATLMSSMGSPAVVGTVTQPTALSHNYGIVWTAQGALADQIVETTNNLTNEPGTDLFLIVRWSQTNANGQGYSVNITNTTAQLTRYDNGVGTNLGAQAVGLVHAAGDVWTLCAAGAGISLYQNYKRILYFYDATYTTGYPGYQQFSSVNVTHNQVTGARIYNCNQQDGIWTKHGTALAALSTDLNGAILGEGIAEPVVLYEGNPQVLAGGNVFKMWCGTNGLSTGIFYAESYDGISGWTRRGGLVVSPNIPGHMIKVGATYYMYAQVPGGNGNVSLYTATDGITFSLINANVFATSVVAWENSTLWDFTPIAVIGGTWYAIYTCTGTGVKPSMGLATAPDGITWTRYGSNPILVGRWCASAFANVGGTWYFWLGANSPGQLSAGNTNWDPNEIVRYTASSNFTVWTPAGHSLRRGEMLAGVNTGNGQIFPSAIVQVGSTTYFYTTPACADGATPNIYQVEVATVPVPLSTVVTLNENTTAQQQADNFPGSGPLSGNWITPTGNGALTIASANHVQATTNTQNCVAIYTGAAFPPNQYAECTITAQVTANDYLILICRGQSSGGLSGYAAVWFGPAGTFTSQQILNRYNNNANVNIGPAVGFTPRLGDVIRFAVTTAADGFPLLSFYQNQFLIVQAEDYTNAWTTGFSGIGVFNFEATLSNTVLSSFAAGNAAVPPPTGGGGSGDLGPGYDFKFRL
jgi:hypothetical protein